MRSLIIIIFLLIPSFVFSANESNSFNAPCVGTTDGVEMTVDFLVSSLSTDFNSQVLFTTETDQRSYMLPGKNLNQSYYARISGLCVGENVKVVYGAVGADSLKYTISNIQTSRKVSENVLLVSFIVGALTASAFAYASMRGF